MTARKVTAPPVTVVRAIKHKVSMGHFEGIETFASISTEVPADADMAEVRGKLDDLLQVLVQSDLEEAAAITAEKKTYIQYWKEGN
jgi:hypothetical protein